MVSFPQVSSLEPCAHLSPPPYVPHATPISFTTNSLCNETEMFPALHIHLCIPHKALYHLCCLYFIKQINIFERSVQKNFTPSIHSLVFSLEGWAWQEPEPSHVTSMALAHCILGKFLGVVCHCFPPPLDVPTLAARCLCPQ